MSAKNVGIVASECYFPRTFVSQKSLEEFDGVSAGKYEIGLGQTNMAFCGAGEDITSMQMSALSNLLEKYGLEPKDIGRLAIGTETINDKSKSSKTSLMPLLGENSDVLGVTCMNACYGGTDALFSTIDWMESSAWDGRYGVVLAGDIAVYEPGPARPTGGAGVVALLVGPDAPLVFENRLRASHFEDVYDFYKPNLESEYPVVDGPLSNSCYLRAVDKCYQLFAKKYQSLYGETFDLFGDAKSANQVIFHQPYCKLVQKSFGRLLYNDMLRDEVSLDSELEEIAKEFKDMDPIQSYTDRALDKACVKASTKEYNDRVLPYTHAGRQLGNSYTGSLYFGLLSLIAQSENDKFLNDRVMMFSYGSGLAATLFSLRVQGSLDEQRTTCNLFERLEDREEISPQDFSAALKEREEFHAATNYTLEQPPASMFPGSYYLSGVDQLSRRSFDRIPMEMSTSESLDTPAAAVAGSRAMHTSSAANRLSFSSSASSARSLQKFAASKPMNLLRRAVFRR